MVVLYILAMPVALLGFAAASVVLDSAQTTNNPGPHGLSEILYAFTSASNNNGSAFAGLTTATQWYDTTLGIAMLVGRFFLIIPVLGIAGSLARKQTVPESAGTFPTHTPLFCWPRRRRRRHRRGPDVLPGPGPRPNRRAVVAVGARNPMSTVIRPVGSSAHAIGTRCRPASCSTRQSSTVRSSRACASCIHVCRRATR